AGDHGDAVDLDARVLREAGHLHRGAGGRILREVAAVDLVDDAEIVHVRQEDVAADHVLESGSGRLEDRPQILHHLARLGRQVALDHRPGLRIERDLPGAEDHLAAIDLHGLRVGTDRLGGLFRLNRLSSHLRLLRWRTMRPVPPPPPLPAAGPSSGDHRAGKSQGPGFHDESGASLVGATGFEPATTCTPSKCATRLRYAPTSWGVGERSCRRPRLRGQVEKGLFRGFSYRPPEASRRARLPAPSSLSAALRICEGRKTRTLRASITISLPVWGLRPIRSFFSRTSKLPKPEIFTFSPRSRLCLMVSKTVSTISADSFLEHPTRS